MDTTPKTADELRALIEQILPGLSPRERKRFWQVMQDHQKNTAFKQFAGMFSSAGKKLIGMLSETMGTVVELGNESVAFEKKLKRHRKPI